MTFPGYLLKMSKFKDCQGIENGPIKFQHFPGTHNNYDPVIKLGVINYRLSSQQPKKFFHFGKCLKFKFEQFYYTNCTSIDEA